MVSIWKYLNSTKRTLFIMDKDIKSLLDKRKQLLTQVCNDLIDIELSMKNEKR